MITVKRVKWGKHYRLAFYDENGKLIGTTKYNRKEGMTVKNIRALLKKDPSLAIAKIPPTATKLRQKIARVHARILAKEHEKEMRAFLRKHPSEFVDYIFRDWFTTTDRKRHRLTMITYQVLFTTHEKTEFHISHTNTILEVFTDYLREATVDFIKKVLPRLANSKILAKISGTTNVENEDFSRKTIYKKIYLYDISSDGTYFKIKKDGNEYDYSLDYQKFVEDYIEKAIKDLEALP